MCEKIDLEKEEAIKFVKFIKHNFPTRYKDLKKAQKKLESYTE